MGFLLDSMAFTDNKIIVIQYQDYICYLMIDWLFMNIKDLSLRSMPNVAHRHWRQITLVTIMILYVCRSIQGSHMTSKTEKDCKFPLSLFPVGEKLENFNKIMKIQENRGIFYIEKLYRLHIYLSQFILQKFTVSLLFLRGQDNLQLSFKSGYIF